MKVKFLIIRFSSIGDIVLTTPVIRCLKQQVNGSIVHYAVKKQFLPLLQANPYIDKIHCFDNNLNAFIRELKNEGFDYIIDLHHNLRTLLIKSRLRILDFSFPKLNYKKWLIVNFKIDRLPRIHIVDRYMKTLALFDVVNDGKGLDYFIPEGDAMDIGKLPADFRNGYVALVVGAKHATKQLPVDKLISLCSLINKPIVLLGGKEDVSAGEAIAQNAKGPVYNACGQFSINQSASLVQQARLVICPDTGLMHIAAAFRKKIISIWGNTIPEFGMAPYLPHEDSRIIQVEGLSCRPCSKIGYASCPKKHFRCMNDIDENQMACLATALF
ncbi:MAG: glycosyltransferase family 9 protein [Bacteroidales bacterium]|nr:glycosyltransferase family 9 protein [Bacteroidales bacterium]MBN2762237.1 glycosyltransferase family 9 protein [Bacteroidales bacterium]